MREWLSDKVSVTKKSVYFPQIIRCFHLHFAVLGLTNVIVNAQLAHIYGFFKITVADKACPIISIFGISRKCTNDPNSTALVMLNAYYLSLYIFAFQ